MDDHHLDPAMPPGDGPHPDSVLATTDQPVAIEIREISDDRVPDGMRCMGTFLDGTLVARCAVPPGLTDLLERHGVFEEPRQLVLAAREDDPGLRCELYAIVPIPEGLLDDERDTTEEEAEPWAVSLPSSRYESVVSDDDADGEEEATDGDDNPAMAAVLLGQIVRFQKDRRHPESLPLETVDVLSRIVSGRVVEVVDKLLQDLLGD
jgi:hypothetical protein